jgi:D-alanyl-D-alanine dipeptidase
MIDCNVPIPIPDSLKTFSYEQIELDYRDEPFVVVVDSDRIMLDMQYAKKGIPLAVATCYLRKTVYSRIAEAALLLPEGYKFKVLDAWRPLEVQKWLYSYYKEIITEKYGDLSVPALKKVIDSFIMPPSENPLAPSVHTTGGAVDLTIVDEHDCDLDMGSGFDEFSEVTNTAFFENAGNGIIAKNRRLLYNIMISQGFTNLPSEWWHFDYGTGFWAFYTKQLAKFAGVNTEAEVLSMIK